MVAEQAISLIAKLLRTIKALMPLLHHLDEIFSAVKQAIAAQPEDLSLAITVLSSANNSPISHALDG